MVGCALKFLDRFQFSVLNLREKNGVAPGMVAIAPRDPERLHVEIGVVQGVDTVLFRQIWAGPTYSIRQYHRS